MTNPMTQPVTPIKVTICAVQHTPDREPVLMQYQGVGVTSGPFARGQDHHTTQTALYNRVPAELRAKLEALGITERLWGDAENKAELLAHLAEHGIAAVIVDNVDPPQPDVPVQATRVDAAAQQSSSKAQPTAATDR